MRIASSSYFSAPKLSFGRALTSIEEVDFKDTSKEALKALDIDDGIHMYKVFQTALPSNRDQDLGVGKLNSQSAIEYLDFMTLYTGSNAIKIYPIGQFPSQLRFPNYYCPYERCATMIGEDNINFYKLTEKEYGSLLSMGDIQQYIVPSSNRTNYENELGLENGADFKLIKQAYNNMISKNTPEAQKIKKEFEKFKASTPQDTFERLAIVPFIRNTDKNLFKGLENSSEKQKRFEKYKEQYSKEIDIYKFGKFLAFKNMAEAKKEFNNRGIDLYGDCPIGFSQDEVIAFPDAFYPKNITPGWGFRAIRYEDISKEGTMANRLFREKISWHLNVFDGIRFDVGWQYFSPKLLKFDKNGNSEKYPIDVKDEIIRFIEETAKSVKGEDFDTRKLMYECDAGADDFQMYDWKDGKPILREIMKGRTPVLTGVYQHASGAGWGTSVFFENTGLNCMYGTDNHDSTPLRILAEEEFDDKGSEIIELADIRENNVISLSKMLNLSKKWLSNSKNFIKAKFAQLFLGKNHFVFFNDVIGSNKRMDKENSDPENYRYRIENNYEEQYHTALQEGYGFNLAESLKLAMRAKSLDKKYPELYKKISFYAKTLYAKGPKTKREAEEMQKISANA